MKLSTATTVNKSNLTQKGQMLDNIGATVSGTSSITIGFSDEFARAKAGWVTEGGRPFNFLSKAEISQLKKQLEDKLFTRIKSLLK